jgi:hypothetical protein
MDRAVRLNCEVNALGGAVPFEGDSELIAADGEAAGGREEAATAVD